jgi:hypothetical protein
MSVPDTLVGSRLDSLYKICRTRSLTCQHEHDCSVRMNYSRFLVIRTTMNSLTGLSRLNVRMPLSVVMVLTVPVSERNTTHRILVSCHVKHLTYLSSHLSIHPPILCRLISLRPTSHSAHSSAIPYQKKKRKKKKRQTRRPPHERIEKNGMFAIV